MKYGRIQVSQPSQCLMNDCIYLPVGHSRTLCVLKGQLKDNQQNKILKEGDVFEHSCKSEMNTLVALEDSMIITIDRDHNFQLEYQNEEMLQGIMAATVAYIKDVKDKL